MSPVVSATLAAASIAEPRVGECRFSRKCLDYANHTGLLDAIARRPLVNRQRQLQGVTYSPLVQLQSHGDVEACNEIIADLLYGQLAADGNDAFVQEVVKVVGELHDNIPSHAQGAGFSAAQVYARQGRKYLEFAVADAGRGMLRNVQKMDLAVKTHGEAITWCLQRGHTTAVPRDDMAQRLPDDCVISPLPKNVSAFSQEDHHMGEGLWKLTELVGACNGSLFVWAGDTGLTIASGAQRSTATSTSWSGVVIEMELPVENFRAATTDEQMMEDLAKRLGI